MINYEDEHFPKPEQPKEFVWTDELVVSFSSWSNTEAPTFQGRYADIEQFKEMIQSKSSHPSTEPDEMKRVLKEDRYTFYKKPAPIDEEEICIGKRYFKENFFSKQQLDEEIEKAWIAARSGSDSLLTGLSQYKQSLSSSTEKKEQPSTFTTSIDEILNFCKEKGFYFGESHLEIIKQLAKSKT